MLSRRDGRVEDTREKQQRSRKIHPRAETGSLRLEPSVSHDTAKKNKYQLPKPDEEDDKICNLQRRCLQAKHTPVCTYHLLALPLISKCAFPPSCVYSRSLVNQAIKSW